MRKEDSFLKVQIQDLVRRIWRSCRPKTGKAFNLISKSKVSTNLLKT